MFATIFPAHQTHSAYEGRKIAGYENTGHNITGT